MKNYSINLKNSIEANTAIHLFEKLGGRCKSDKLDFTGFLYLIDGVITERISDKDIGRTDIKEVTMDALKCLANPRQLTPKFPKVWAWDDNVSEAFETYLIAEFEGFEYKYLCVAVSGIESFEQKDYIRTDQYKNSSNTAPKEKEIQEIAERIRCEYRKYNQIEEIDWALMSAKKIYETYLKNK